MITNAPWRNRNESQTLNWNWIVKFAAKIWFYDEKFIFIPILSNSHYCYDGQTITQNTKRNDHSINAKLNKASHNTPLDLLSWMKHRLRTSRWRNWRKVWRLFNVPQSFLLSVQLLRSCRQGTNTRFLLKSSVSEQATERHRKTLS